jgi:carbonic anhydrase
MRLYSNSLAVAVLASLSLVALRVHATDETPSVPPAAALEHLKTGNSRFAEGKLAHPHTSGPERKELAKGQHPEAIILSCSDSRVPPELVFEKGLGELFTVRVAGNILGAATVASIEYAAEHLGSRLIVVMGHESCGAVKAALSTAYGQSTGSYDLDSLISSIQGNLDGRRFDRAIASAHIADDKTLRKPVMANVDAVATDLIKRSKIVARLVGEGKLRIVRGIYSLETGKVDFWDAPGAAAEH